MCQNKICVNMGFTDESFPEGTHMCMIYSNESERKKIISQFLEGGLSSGEKVTYFVDEASPDEIMTWLSEMGVAIPETSKGASFNIATTAETYHPTGIFEPEKMLNTLKAYYETAKGENYMASRVTGEMSWALKGIPGSDLLMVYESKVNDVVEKYPVTAICQYDANKFDGATIFECLKVHPFMIVHGQIVKNPYYMKTDDYLEERSGQ